MVVNPGVLAVNMVDNNLQPVATPLVDMGSTFQSDACQTATSIFGTPTQQIYIKNPGVANNGWTVTLSAASPLNAWQAGGAHLDFNDATNLGCTDGPDIDTYA